jgi:hypothetical protein
MMDDRDPRRTSNMTIRWRPSFDTNRRLTCSAFGIDFGSLICPGEKVAPCVDNVEIGYLGSQGKRSLERQCRQRIAVYMQRATVAAVPGPKVPQFTTSNLLEYAADDTVILCEYSSVDIGEIVNTGALLALNPVKYGSDNSFASASAIESITRQILEEVHLIWRYKIAAVHEPHAELEDAIYSQPANPHHARYVWAMSKRLHGMVKLVNRHLKIVETIQEDFQPFSERSEEQDFLDHILEDLGQLADTIRVDYLDPLEHMIDMVRE